MEIAICVGVGITMYVSTKIGLWIGIDVWGLLLSWDKDCYNCCDRLRCMLKKIIKAGDNSEEFWFKLCQTLKDLWGRRSQHSQSMY